jgi:hypothetical protein
MRPHTSARRLLSMQALGIVAVVALIWSNEYLDLPHLLFGEVATLPRFGEFAVEAVVAIAFGAVVMLTTWQMCRRVAYLESLLLLCASCQRIGVDGEWVSFEQLVAARDHLATTHGICSQCYDAQTTDLAPQAVSR